MTSSRTYGSTCVGTSRKRIGRSFRPSCRSRRSTSPGTLGAIATVIGENGANIDNIVMQPISPDFRVLFADVEVTDLRHLSSIVSQLRARPIVSKVERVNG